jgi:hypothetical protein
MKTELRRIKEENIELLKTIKAFKTLVAQLIDKKEGNVQKNNKAISLECFVEELFPDNEEKWGYIYGLLKKQIFKVKELKKLVVAVDRNILIKNPYLFLNTVWDLAREQKFKSKFFEINS